MTSTDCTLQTAFAELAAPNFSEDSQWRHRGAELGQADDPLVFYVHPTTAQGPAWFGDLGDSDLEARTSELTNIQLRAFPGRTWAPRYRQATTRAFHERTSGGDDAYEIAYQDVSAAFAEFLADIALLPDPVRPIVLTGHSQGAKHVLSLLDEFFSDPELANRLVAAYVIGVPVPETGDGSLRWFPPATDADAVGVVVGYNAVLAGADKAGEPVAAQVCVNPLTASAVVLNGGANEHVLVDVDAVEVSAGVRGGVLEVSPVQPGALDAVVLPGGNLHRVEVELFTGNLRADVRRRNRQWLRSAGNLTDFGASEDVTGPVPLWPEVHGRRVRIHDGWVHYVELGTAQGPAVVMLHKLGGWVADWRHVAELVAQRYRVVVVDIPGHGGSIMDGRAPWAHSPRVSARRVNALLDVLGIDDAHVVGSSLGGIVGLLVTITASARVRTLTLVGVSMTERHTLALTLENDNAVKKFFTDDWYPLPLGAAAADRAATNDPRIIDEQDSSRSCAGRWARPSERGVGLSGVAHLLPHVEAPVLVVNGERAGYRRYEATARDCLRDVRIETVADAGSFPHQERAGEVARLWETFVEAVDARKVQK